MRSWGLVALAAVSCYRAPVANEACTITCTEGVEGSCPGDLTCRGGFCVADGQVCRPAFTQVAAGTGFACALDEDGALWCWGDNRSGQIGGVQSRVVPRAMRIDDTRSYDAIAAGGGHACAIAAGKLFCWGKNDRGQVTAAVGSDVADPLEIALVDGPSAWTAVATGRMSTCAIGDGRLWCWGANESGQLGDGTLQDRDLPTPVMTSLTDWVAIAIGRLHTCAISSTAGVHCWGDGTFGQLGPNAANPEHAPFQVRDALGEPLPASAIAVSERASCAIVHEQVHCWGDNNAGEHGELRFGMGGTATPVLASDSRGWTALAAGERMFCGLRDAQAVCWGSTSAGVLGNGYWTQGASDRVFATVSGTQGATGISIGWDDTELALACVVADGDVRCWGDNRFGQLGIGAATMEVTPTPVAGDHMFIDLHVGASHACGIADGAVLCWGSTELGAATGVRAGNSVLRVPCIPGLDCDVAAPKQLNFFSTSATKVALGAYHSCAYHNDVITCWGDNSQGQLVNNNPTPPRERTIPAPGGAAWFELLETGRYGQCARYRSTGSQPTACWGDVLGARNRPTQITELEGVRALALGTGPNGNFDCIVDADVAFRCQGDNSFGQFGDGTTSSSATLTPADPGREYIAIATNQAPTMCGVTPAGGVECWGQNDRGQTGSADVTSPTLTPSPLPGLGGCTKVAVGLAHACALCDHAIWCWGDNRFGQLGSGGLDDDPVPTPRLAAPANTDDPPVRLAAGSRFTCARSSRGQVACWGFDPRAALGNGGRSANLPVTVQATPAR
jgi:alpha-tubulin suppressor-like RCC1 family protein